MVWGFGVWGVGFKVLRFRVFRAYCKLLKLVHRSTHWLVQRFFVLAVPLCENVLSKDLLLGALNPKP